MSYPINMCVRQSYSVDQLVITPPEFKPDLKEILIPRGLIEDRILQMAEDISENYGNQEFLAVCVLDGGKQFFDSLIGEPPKFPHAERVYWRAKSYEGIESTGRVELGEIDFSVVRGRKVLVFEDIIETGKTSKVLLDNIKANKPKDVKTVYLLDKPDKRIYYVEIHLSGFEIPGFKFVVGCGLDFNEKYRDLNHLGVLKDEIYAGREQK